MDATRKTVIVTDSSCDLSDEPVSYTHLDVYKRQGLFPAAAARTPAFGGKSKKAPKRRSFEWLIPC